MEIIDVGASANDGTGDALRTAFQKANTNATYNAAVIQATHSLCGFDREDTATLGILQYCYSAASGDVHQIDEDGVYSLLTSQTHFADGTTALADRTLAQYHSSTETQFSYWYQATLVVVTGIKTFQLPDDNNSNYIEYTAAGDMAVVTDAPVAIVSGSLVSLLQHNTISNQVIWFADERHGVVMDGQTHLNIHMTRKLSWVNGCDLEGLANNGVTFTKVTSGRFGDEDIPMAMAEITTAPYMFVDTAGNFDISTTDDNKLAHFVDSKVVYNPLTAGIGALAEINLDYVIMTLFGTNNKIHPYVKLVGQTLYPDRDDARIHLYPALNELDDGGLPNHELRALGSYIIHNEATGQLEIGADEEVWIDHRRGYPVARF